MGRELLAKNDGSFKITKFALGDDDINYQLYDATASSPDADLTNLPVLEPISNENVAQKYRLISLPKGSLKISTLSLKPTKATADFGDTVTFTVQTDNGEDSQGWNAVSRNTDIGKLESPNALPVDGIGTFTLLTGPNAGAANGTTVVDVVGINTGSRATFELTVSSSS